MADTTRKVASAHPAETRAEALRLKSQGESYSAIARRLNVSRESVRRWCDPAAEEKHRQANNACYQRERSGKKPHGPGAGISEATKLEAIRLREQGFPYRKIAAALGISYTGARLCCDGSALAKQRQSCRLHYWANREKQILRTARRHSEKPEQSKEYYLRNKEIYYANSARRRASKVGATPSWLTSSHLAETRAIHAEAIRLTSETGVEHHVDHVYPLRGKGVVSGRLERVSCGLHVPWNLQILTASENCSKSCLNPDPVDHPPTAW